MELKQNEIIIRFENEPTGKSKIQLEKEKYSIAYTCTVNQMPIPYMIYIERKNRNKQKNNLINLLYSYTTHTKVNNKYISTYVTPIKKRLLKLFSCVALVGGVNLTLL